MRPVLGVTNNVGPDAFVRADYFRFARRTNASPYEISPGAFAVDSRTTNSGSIAISEG